MSFCRHRSCQEFRPLRRACRRFLGNLWVLGYSEQCDVSARHHNSESLFESSEAWSKHRKDCAEFPPCIRNGVMSSWLCQSVPRHASHDVPGVGSSWHPWQFDSHHLTDRHVFFQCVGPAAVKGHGCLFYMLENGWISMAGVTSGNAKYIAQAIDDVVRNIRSSV